MKPLVLTACSIESALGSGLSATLDSLRNGRSGLRRCSFETVDLDTAVGMVDGLEREPVGAALADYDCRNNRLAQRALGQRDFACAVAAARKRYGAHRIGVFAGTSTAGIHETELAFRRHDAATGALDLSGLHYRGAHNTYSITDFTRCSLDLRGPALAVSTACASTAKVFGVAARMIELGLCDAAVVGGADSLCLTTLYGFHALQLTAREPCRPFDRDRDGISIGEAAGYALLERAEHAERGSGIALLGVGESSDAYHMSSPHPEGKGALAAMELALSAAGLVPTDIDYVNLHGTATRVGDAVEDRAITALLGATPCNSTKGLTGHTLGASGIVEAVIAALCIEHGFIPASPTTRHLDPQCTSHYCREGVTRPLQRVMSNSFGFGGSNCSVILGRLT